MRNSPVEVTRASYLAYVDKDRAAIEALIADDFHFTSPLDNALDRKTYFERCWPGSKEMKSFEILEECGDDRRAFVIYELEMSKGKRFRNCELHTVRGGKLVSVEVYFG